MQTRPTATLFRRWPVSLPFRGATCVLAGLVLIATIAAPATAQEKSVRPGINEGYKSPDTEKFVKRFEREGRDVFDKRNELVAACEIEPGDAVADVGAGTGLFVGLFAEAAGPDGKVFAVDITENFIKLIDKRATEAGWRNVRTVLCTADSTELPADSVDVAFVCDVYHHLEFPAKTMQSLHQAMRPGGMVVLIDFERIEGKSAKWIMGHVRAGKETVIKEVEAVGFKLIDEKDLLTENYVIRFKRL